MCLKLRHSATHGEAEINLSSSMIGNRISIIRYISAENEKRSKAKNQLNFFFLVIITSLFLNSVLLLLC